MSSAPTGRFTAQMMVCMSVTLRTTFMVIAALSASSVAPAQVNVAAQPVTQSPAIEGTNSVPADMSYTPLPQQEADSKAKRRSGMPPSVATLTCSGPTGRR